MNMAIYSRSFSNFLRCGSGGIGITFALLIFIVTTQSAAAAAVSTTNKTTIGDGLPSGLSFSVNATQSSPIPRGSDVRLVVRVRNTSSSNIGGVYITLARHFHLVQLKASKPSVTNESGSDFFSWRNQAIPANSHKDYSITFQVDPNTSFSSLNNSVTVTESRGGFAHGQMHTVNVAVTSASSASQSSTPKSTTTKSGSLASISDLNSLFRQVYGRTPTVAEWHYWADRLLDKSDRTALLGAMYYHKALGRTTGDRVQGAVSSKVELGELNSVFHSVYSRNPSQSEWHYWASRLQDKADRGALTDAMAYHMIGGIEH